MTLPYCTFVRLQLSRTILNRTLNQPCKGLVLNRAMTCVSAIDARDSSFDREVICRLNFLGNTKATERHRTRTIKRLEPLTFSSASTATQPLVDASPPPTQSQPQNDKESKPFKRLPSDDELETVYRKLSEQLPRFFVETLDYNLYTKDIVFEDRIRGRVVKGINDYMLNLSFLRIKGHLSYSSIGFKILKITKHEEEAAVKVRWQIRGIPGWRVFLTFWRYLPFSRNNQPMSSDVYDGFSTFFVNSEGKIYRHVADKMMPDDDKLLRKSPLDKIPVNLV